MTNTKTQNPFVPGAEVATQAASRFGRRVDWKLAKVEKVYKNGRFTLEGSASQWTPCQDNQGNWRAYQRSKDKWVGGAELEPVSDRIREEMAVQMRIKAGTRLLREIENLARRADAESKVADLDAIRDALVSLKRGVGA